MKTEEKPSAENVKMPTQATTLMNRLLVCAYAHLRSDLIYLVFRYLCLLPSAPPFSVSILDPVLVCDCFLFPFRYYHLSLPIFGDRRGICAYSHLPFETCSASAAPFFPPPTPSLPARTLSSSPSRLAACPVLHSFRLVPGAIHLAAVSAYCLWAFIMFYM